MMPEQAETLLLIIVIGFSSIILVLGTAALYAAWAV